MVAFLILLLFAVILLVAGGVLLYFRNTTKQKSALMSQTETSSASDVSGLAPGTLVEVKGTLRCEDPLTSEMAEKTCAYYSSTVTREYLRPDYDDDDNDVGSDRRSEVMAQNVQFAPFTVEDDSGAVAVDAEGAEVDARQVMNRFDRNAGNEGTFSLGGVSINLSGGRGRSATAIRRASFRSTRGSTCSAPCRRTAGSGPHSPVKRAIGSSSATARRKRWDRASVRPFSGSAWGASQPWSLVWSCWSWG